MKALITGGNGFIGSHVVDSFLANGHEVRCIVRPSANLRWLNAPNVELFQGNLGDPESLKRALKGVDCVVHIAGSLIEKDWDGFYNANVRPVKLLLDACVRSETPIQRFTLVSSTGAAGPSADGTPLKESDPCHPVSLYGWSKLEGEQVAKAYFHALPVTIVRPSAVYGPRDPNFVKVFKDVRKGFTPLLGKEDHYANMVHAEELADGILAATLSPAAVGQTYFLASEKAYTQHEVLDVVGDILGRRSRRPTVPKGPAIALMKAWATLMIKVLHRRTLLDPDRIETLSQRFWVFDVSKAKAELGFKEKYTLAEGMKQTYEWYQSRGWLEADMVR